MMIETLQAPERKGALLRAEMALEHANAALRRAADAFDEVGEHEASNRVFSAVCGLNDVAWITHFAVVGADDGVFDAPFPELMRQMRRLANAHLRLQLRASAQDLLYMDMELFSLQESLDREIAKLKESGDWFSDGGDE